MTRRAFELRTYTVHPGRMPAMNARFREHTNRLLEKHGMTLLGFWHPADPARAETTLIYLVAHASREAADRNWQTFGADPAWQQAKAASEQDGPIVAHIDRMFLDPTDYSALQ